MDTRNAKLNKDIKNRLKRGVVLGVTCAAVTLLILFLLRDNLTVGAATAVPAVILVYFLLGRFF